MADEIDRLESNKKRINYTQNIAKIPYNYLFIVFGIIALSYYAYTTSHITKKNFQYLFALAVILFVILILKSGDKGRRLLTEPEARAFAEKELNIKKRSLSYEYLDGKLIPNYSHLVKSEMALSGQTEYISYKLGYIVELKDGREKYILVELDPYSGELRGIEERKEGYTGREDKDKVVIPLPGYIQENFKEVKEEK